MTALSSDRRVVAAPGDLRYYTSGKKGGPMEPNDDGPSAVADDLRGSTRAHLGWLDDRAGAGGLQGGSGRRLS